MKSALCVREKAISSQQYTQNEGYTEAIPYPFPLASPHEPLKALPYPERPSSIDGEQLATLTKQGFTNGLAKALNNNCESFPVRY